MMHSTRNYIAIRTAEPLGKMKAFGIVGDGLENLAVGVFDGFVPLAGHDGRIVHFFMTTIADSHDFLAARKF